MALPFPISNGGTSPTRVALIAVPAILGSLLLLSTIATLTASILLFRSHRKNRQLSNPAYFGPDTEKNPIPRQPSNSDMSRRPSIHPNDPIAVDEAPPREVSFDIPPEPIPASSRKPSEVPKEPTPASSRKSSLASIEPTLIPSRKPTEAPEPTPVPSRKPSSILAEPTPVPSRKSSLAPTEPALIPLRKPSEVATEPTPVPSRRPSEAPTVSSSPAPEPTFPPRSQTFPSATEVAQRKRSVPPTVVEELEEKAIEEDKKAEEAAKEAEEETPAPSASAAPSRAPTEKLPARAPTAPPPSPSKEE